MILVFGNPRSGTTSVAQALTDMGYNTLHMCPLSKSNENMSIRELFLMACGQGGFQAVVSWRLTSYYEELFNLYKDTAIYIYCHRSDKTSWKKSMEQFSFSKEDIIQFSNKTDEFITEISPVSFLNTHMFDITRDGYNKLTKILNVENIETPLKFPHVNKSENIYEI